MHLYSVIYDDFVVKFQNFKTDSATNVLGQ